MARDVKRVTASVVLAGRHIQLTQRESARGARAAVRSYREQMAEHAALQGPAGAQTGLAWREPPDRPDGGWPPGRILGDWATS
jgi:Uncharacterized protein conserved in bacteria (DUF2252)